MKLVKFIENSAPYAKGDIAGFEDKIASKLISVGVAVAYEVPKPKKGE